MEKNKITEKLRRLIDSNYKSDFQKRELAARAQLKLQHEEYEAFFANKLKKAIEQEGLQPEIIDDSLVESDFFPFEKPEYRVVTFQELTFGKAKAASVNDLSLVSGARFYYCRFAECTFSNIQFENCSFVGCKFDECFTNNIGVVFDNCTFKSVIPGKKSVDDMFTTFDGCEMTARFSGCDLSQVVLNKTNLYFSQFQAINFNGAILCDCGFDTVVMSDCDFRGMKIVGTKFIDFSLEDLNTRSRVDRNSFFGEIAFSPKLSREVRFAAEAYGQFNELFENNKVTILSGEYFYLFKKTDLLQLDRTSKVISYFGLLTCGYGERPFFSLILSTLIVAMCGLLYMVCGVSLNNEILAYRPTLSHPLPDWGLVTNCFHFSLVTFSTTGYGNVTPLGGSLLVSAAEMVLGIVMVGVFVSTLVRKTAR